MNGLSLLNPAGLLALAALAIPLLIHLFSRSRGRRVPVGNIALYRQARQQRVLEPRPVQWLLLLLRLLLLALIALLLAGLVRPGLETVEGDTAYVTPEWLAVTDDPGGALVNMGQAFVLVDGYPPVGSPPAESSIDASADPAIDPWSLLAERLATVRHDGEVHVHALAAARQFPAAAPALPRSVTWHFEETAPAGDDAPPGLAVRLLHAPNRARDADRLAAALAAVAAHRRVGLTVTRGLTTEAGQAPPAVDDPGAGDARRALIWLDDTPAPDLGADVVLEDHASGPGTAVTVALPGSPALHFRARPAPAPGGDVRWRADDGRPVLVSREAGGALRLQYLDRLDGDPDGPVTREVFPDVLLRLLLGEAAWAAGSDRAPANPAAAVARPATPGSMPHRPLAPWLALAAALLFGLERWLSERPRRETGAAVP